MHKKSCSNNCEFAKKSLMTAYSSKCGEDYIDADYLWRCMVIDRVITVDSDLWRLGCASYSNRQQNQIEDDANSLIIDVNKKLDEITAVMPKPIIVEPTVVPVVTTPVSVVPEPAVTTAATSPQTDQISVPIHNMTPEKPEPVAPAVLTVEPKKKRGRPARSEPAEMVKDTPPITPSLTVTPVAAAEPVANHTEPVTDGNSQPT